MGRMKRINPATLSLFRPFRSSTPFVKLTSFKPVQLCTNTVQFCPVVYKLVNLQAFPCCEFLYLYRHRAGNAWKGHGRCCLRVNKCWKQQGHSFSTASPHIAKPWRNLNNRWRTDNKCWEVDNKRSQLLHNSPQNGLGDFKTTVRDDVDFFY